MPLVSVCLPVCRVSPHLEGALACVLGQTAKDLEVLLVANGVGPEERERVEALAGRDERVRLLELPQANLAAACNLALREARAPLVARMDDDDVCPVERLERQAEVMDERPRLAALATGFELLGQDDRPRLTVRPPAEPGALRARLLLGNTLAHGSVMLRREAVLAAGGYDERLARAQDYDLWLRLSRERRIGCLPEVLYGHRERSAAACSSAEQARVAAGLMLREWAMLPREAGEGLAEHVAAALREERPAGEIAAAMDAELERAESAAGLLARLWLDRHAPPMERRAAEVCRESRLREVGRLLRESNVERVWLWGAGNQGRWVAEWAGALGVEVVGFVDDAVERLGGPVGNRPHCDAPVGNRPHGNTSAGERPQCLGLAVVGPGAVEAGDVVLIASDAWHDAIFERSLPLRERGVRVVPLYGDAEAALAVSGDGAAGSGRPASNSASVTASAPVA